MAACGMAVLLPGNPSMLSFYFDFVSPFSYLASIRLPEIVQRYGISVSYKPIDIACAKRAIGNVGPSNRDMPVKLTHLSRDLQRWAQRYGTPLKFPPSFDSRRLNTGFFYAAGEGRQAEYVRRAFHLTWGMGQAFSDETVLRGIASEMGWNVDDFMQFTDSVNGANEYKQSIDEGIARRVFGVPMVVIGDEMWWGNDRLDFVDEYLQSRASN
jgi:2-hydroxychromene-2-carboxylate isomerase